MTLTEFKLNNSIRDDIKFTDRAVILKPPCPWNWYIAFEDSVYDQAFQVVVIGSYNSMEYVVWTSLGTGTDDLPKSVIERINTHLGLLGFNTKDKSFLLYPNKDDGFFFNKNGSSAPCYNQLAKYFKAELKVKNDDTYSCIYDKGYYRDLSRIELSNLIDTLTKDQASSAQHEAFKKKIISKCFYPKKEFDPPEGYVNLNNGILNVKTRELLPHNHDFNFRYKLDHDYVEGATAPNFLEFMNFIFDNNTEIIKLIGEIMGYTLIGGDPFLHKAFIFYGDGRNGKSTLLDVIKELLGKHSVSSVGMDRLNEPFSVVRLDGKLANIVEEAPSMINNEAFKKIVGGGEVAAARKHMDEYDLKVSARMFFACNDYPYFKDSSKGLKDRLIIVPFNRYIPEEERDPKIKGKLFKEMPGILNFALKGYERLVANGNKLTNVDAIEKSVNDYLSETDSVVSWGEEHLLFTENLADKVYITTLYESYKIYCKENGYQSCNNKTFGKRLKRHLDNMLPKNFHSEDLYSREKAGRYLSMMKCKGAPQNNPVFAF